MASRQFGEVPGYPVGTTFEDRASLSEAGVHRPTQKGISGGQHEGADSIVLSGGYPDDEDAGREVIYTGEGGQDPVTRKQIADQEWVRGNAALRVNLREGLPVRVVRGAHPGSQFAPKTGYRYDGLYVVTEAWRDSGREGFEMCRVRLERDDLAQVPWVSSLDRQPPPRVRGTVQRIVRNTATSTHVKQLHDYRCQVCGTRIEAPGGPYAEGAHIRPLGSPHDGPDLAENILCLCPNHHVLFDLGAFAIGPDGKLIGCDGALRLDPSHRVAGEHLEYHKRHIYRGS